MARGLHVICRLSRSERQEKIKEKQSISNERWRRVRRVLTVVTGDRSIAIVNACALNEYCSLVQLAVAEYTERESWREERGEKGYQKGERKRERERKQGNEKRPREEKE